MVLSTVSRLPRCFESHAAHAERWGSMNGLYGENCLTHDASPAISSCFQSSVGEVWGIGCAWQVGGGVRARRMTEVVRARLCHQRAYGVGPA